LIKYSRTLINTMILLLHLVTKSGIEILYLTIWKFWRQLLLIFKIVAASSAWILRWSPLRNIADTRGWLLCLLIIHHLINRAILLWKVFRMCLNNFSIHHLASTIQKHFLLLLLLLLESSFLCSNI
jgi:hypothetical protein